MKRRRVHPYRVRIGGVLVDPYRIAIAYGLDGVKAAALKKVLRGGRQDKSEEQDVIEAIATLRRWLQIRKELKGGHRARTSKRRQPRKESK